MLLYAAEGRKKLMNEEHRVALNQFVASRWEEDKRRIVCESYPAQREEMIERFLKHYDTPEMHAALPSVTGRIIDELGQLVRNSCFMPKGLWPEIIKKVGLKKDPIPAQ